MASPWNRRAILIIAGLGLLLRLGLAARDLDVVDRLFVPDDTYYLLSIARSMAQGKGPSVDGEHVTSGFQPLAAFLLTPILAVVEGHDPPLRAALLLFAFFDGLNILLLAALARRFAGPMAALVAAALWAASPVAIANALGALETSLALCCTMALVEFWCRARDKTTRRAYAIAGVLAGLALLSRADTVFIVAGLGLIELLKGDRRRLAIAIGAAAIVVAPWWIYMLVNFGTIVPESGDAVRRQVLLHQARYLTLSKQLAWALGTVLGPPLIEAQSFRQWLMEQHTLSGTLAVALLGGIGGGTWAILRRASRADRWPLAALTIHGATILLFYALYLPALWFFRRYLAPTHVLITLLLAGGVGLLWQKRDELATAAKAALGATAVGVLLAASVSLSWLALTPQVTIDTGLHGAKGYRDVAKDVLAKTKKHWVLGALQSGALAYYAWPDRRVVNLDGVVDGAAARAFKARQLGTYAKKRGVTHIVDWPFNLRAFLEHSNPSRAGRPRLRVIGRAKAQGPDHALITAIEYPPTSATKAAP